MTHHAPDDAGHPIAQIATVVAARLPAADIDRLTGQIAALKLLPHHAGDLLEYLEAHPEALTSGAATGPPALRRLLDVLAADHPAVQRMRCNGCGAQTRLPYRKDGASICGNCYRRTHQQVCVRCGQAGQPAFRESGGIVCTRCMARDPAHKHACARCGTIARVAYRVDGHAADQHELLDLAEAQREPVIQPHAVRDDLRRIPVTLIRHLAHNGPSGCVSTPRSSASAAPLTNLTVPLRTLLATVRVGGDPHLTRHRLHRFLSWCIDSQIPELLTLAATIDTWWPEINAFVTTGITNARTEGYNRLVKQVKRVGCGFRNRDNSTRRIRFHCTRKQRAATQISC